MKTSLSTPAVIGIIVAVVAVVVVIGWRYLNGANRDRNGQDLSRPAVQPANMGEMFRSHVNANRGGNAAGGGGAPGQTPAR